MSLKHPDLVGFTAAAMEFTPEVLIGKYLVHIFSAFDKLAERRGLEKIKTIGDGTCSVYAHVVIGVINTYLKRTRKHVPS